MSNVFDPKWAPSRVSLHVALLGHWRARNLDDPEPAWLILEFSYDHLQVRLHTLREKHLTQLFPDAATHWTLGCPGPTSAQQRRVSDCMAFLMAQERTMFSPEEDQPSTLASPGFKHFSLWGQQHQGQTGRSSLVLGFIPYLSHLTHGRAKWEESCSRSLQRSPLEKQYPLRKSDAQIHHCRL